MRGVGALVIALFVTSSRCVVGQDAAADYVERGPRFLLASATATSPARVDVGKTPVLRQRISLDLNGVALGEALREVSVKAGLQLAFSNTILPAERTVTFRADQITVAAALTELLIDAQVDVLFSRDGRAVLVRRAELFEEGTVTGRVTDGKTGQGVAGARVTLQGTSLGALTNDSGGFRVANVPAGTYTVTVRRIGYAQGVGSVTVTADEEAVVELKLELSASPLDAVVVTGTLVPTEVKALPSPISIITGEDIRRQNLGRIDQVFRGGVPGAIAWDVGPLDYYSDVAFRGASTFVASSAKTFIDGIEVADPHYIATIDPNSVDRIEITRGPQASTLYGAAALNGVIQVFTKKGRLGLTRPEITAKLSAGGVGGFDGQSTAFQTDNAVSVLGGSEKSSYNVGGSYSRVGDWVPSYHSTDWGVSAGGQTTQGPLTLSSSARYADKRFDWPWDTRFQAYTRYSQPYYQPTRLRQQTYGVTASFRATPNWQHTLTLGYDQRNYSFNQTQPRFTTPADSFLSVYANHEAKTSLLYHTDVALRLGRGVAATVTGGVNYVADDYVDAFTSGATRTSGSLDGSSFVTRSAWDNTGYFGQVQFNVVEHLFLTGGLRAERNDNFGTAFGTAWSPRAGVAYAFGLGPARVKLRTSYGESIRAPLTSQREAVQDAFRIQLANPGLAPERQRGSDGGVEVYLGQASLGVTYYNQRAIDLIQRVTIPAPPGALPTSQYQNIGRVKNEGWEFEARLPLGPIQLASTYSITTSTVRELPSNVPAGTYQVGDRVLGIPHTAAGAAVTYSPLSGTTVTATLTHFGHWINMDQIAYYAYLYGGQPYRGSQRAYWIEYPSVTKFGMGVSQELSQSVASFVRAENVGNSLRFEQINSNIPMPRRIVVGATVRY